MVASPLLIIIILLEVFVCEKSLQVNDPLLVCSRPFSAVDHNITMQGGPRIYNYSKHKYLSDLLRMKNLMVGVIYTMMKSDNIIKIQKS